MHTANSASNSAATVSPITILLADDHHVVRQGVRALLQTEPDFSVVGEASNGLEALRLVEKLNPSVLVVDLSMPGLNGLEVTRQISDRWLKTRVVVLSMHSNEHYITDALKYGAFGYVFKNSPTEQLVRAIRDVAAGLHYLPPPFSEIAIDAFIENAKRTVRDSYESLTTREREVLQLAAEGHTAAEIGARLFISPRTVEIHRANLMRKLSLRNQADLIRYAFEKGLLPLDEPLNQEVTGPGQKPPLAKNRG